jgi:hypothetical protein
LWPVTVAWCGSSIDRAKSHLSATTRTLCFLGRTGVVAHTCRFDALIAGLWVGFKLYGKLDDTAFRKVILVLLLIAGLGLILPREI